MAATSVSCRSAAQAPPRRRKKRVSTGRYSGPWTIETGDQVPGWISLRARRKHAFE
jgi:hypothetical protein